MGDNPSPLVSVLVASYNYADYIKSCIESALGQSNANLEVIVVDDGSTDNSFEIISELAERDSRIKLYTHPERRNAGLCSTLSLGITKARGKYVAFLESDDLWEQDALKKRLRALSLSGCRAVFNDIELLKMPGARTQWHDGYVSRVAMEHKESIRKLEAEGKAPALDLRMALLSENKIPTFSCAMLETELLRSCSLTSPVIRWMDWWLWMQVSHQSCFAYVPERLTYWRMHTASYNHHVPLKRYFRDSQKLWRGFRAFPKKMDEKPNFLYRLLLNLPFWGRMLLRLGLTFRRSGVRGGLRAIKYRIS